MIRSLKRWIGGQGRLGRLGRPASGRRSARPLVEGLEGRQLLTVTYGGGALLAKPEVQAVFYGSDWQNNSTYSSQASYLTGYLNTIVQSPYMDMLTNAGYGVGRGSFDGGVIDGVNVNKSQGATDTQLRSALQSLIDNGSVKAPNSNSLYVIYVEDNVVVSAGGENSQTNFLGYHEVFAGTNASGSPVDVHYAVVAYPGGSVNNAAISYVSTLGDLTEVASHELAEAATDPNYGYKAMGWYDLQAGGLGEVGDLAAGQTVYVDGYAVQRIVDQADQPMTPVDATALSPENFVLQSNGTLIGFTSSGSTQIATGVASISSQSIDFYGHAVIDLVTTGGVAYEYHAGLGFNQLATGVKSASAGEGVSYVLLTNGNLEEYKESTGKMTTLAGGIASIDAGTDKLGGSMVDLVTTTGAGWEYSDSSGWHYLASGVSAVSAGQQGFSTYLTTAGNAYDYQDATGASAFVASGVAAITAGTDANGNVMVDLLFDGGQLYQYQASTGWTELTTGVRSISKGVHGVVGVISTAGNAYNDANGQWNGLTSNAVAIA